MTRISHGVIRFLYQRIVAANSKAAERGIVLIGSRRMMTADLAELRLPTKLDGGAMLFIGRLDHLVDLEVIGKVFVSVNASGPRAPSTQRKLCDAASWRSSAFQDHRRRHHGNNSGCAAQVTARSQRLERHSRYELRIVPHRNRTNH
ncbi:nitrate reductase, large subunit [Hyphomicrobium denitrificans 1NES1]|uniref:Nitrate reductase, large subunit n=1 Tax=Hyphomicrobium denitrificans 1NES1 TaxID=670307 RepID=N0B9R1_9HYPH|nr:nitrate reductase, large subunit [Hyphomicrobium denitrificans 1NES1]